ncbi:MAG: endopeptidase La [Firmicutes bacterium]|nr:endopeptidase La [Bacillota bacterium]
MNSSLPVMLLKGLVLLPNQEVKLDINNKISKKTVMISSKDYKNELLVVCPKDQKEEEPEVTDLPFVGVVCKITSKIELSNGHLKIKVRGLKRVAIEEYSNNVDDIDILECSFKEIILPRFSEVEILAAKRKLIEVLKEYLDLNPAISNSILATVRNESDIYKITDQITLFVPLNIEKKLEYMEEINALKRARNLIKDLSIEVEVSMLNEKLDDNLANELENSQKEFILKEKMKQIKKELGETNDKSEEVNNYLEKLESLKISKNIHDRLISEIKKYDFTNELSPDMTITRNYIEYMLSLPWNTLTKDEENIINVKKVLDKSHYGLEEIKERILEYVSVKKRNKEIKSPIICLVGPPGVGKTTFAFSIANALNKKFAKISVGGLNDSSELNGHRKTYIAASPGKIIQSIRKCGSRNPIILIDEIDKMVKDYKGDPASVLLDILDYEQNKIFVDNYIEEEFDLSKVMFILTANNKDNIPEELLDRLEIIEMASYTENEKIDIAKKYIIPKLFKEYDIKTKEIKISVDTIRHIIRDYTKEAGVRELERAIDKIIRKVITSNHSKNEIKVNLDSKHLEIYLGVCKYNYDMVTKNNNIGVVNGLAYTPYGGIITPIESVMYDGDGKIKVTGHLGDILKESVDVSLSYIRANSDEFRIKKDIFKNKDFHIHMLDGAIKKDGPSAGIAITTSLIGLLINKKVNNSIALTGELSLTGEVLEVGGIKEKIIGAYNNNIKTIFIPKKNHKDLKMIPDDVKKSLNIIEISNYIEVYNNIFG